MKLHEAATTPNCRRVRIFLAEKGIEIPVVPVDVGKAENRQDAFRKKNPMGRVPVLELDDGTFIAESVAICRYFEQLQPEPALMGGGDPEQVARIEMWQRRMELEITVPIMQVFRNTHPYFADRIDQYPDYGESQRRHATKRLAWLDQELADREFVAGDQYSIADITAQIGIDFGRVTKFRVTEETPNLLRWHQAVSARPSAKA
ncbi:MAG: glutathione S-transferase family protein [Acidobacteria bacterium]|nr:glutathione S-transferase family protein [Acidobacteriota bacterium]MCY3964438.1 glutathione S-transferase family protein [Acidobacteriota bacterium]